MVEMAGLGAASAPTQNLKIAFVLAQKTPPELPRSSECIHLLLPEHRQFQQGRENINFLHECTQCRQNDATQALIDDLLCCSFLRNAQCA
jgi:hypothetical protein